MTKNIPAQPSVSGGILKELQQLLELSQYNMEKNSFAVRDDAGRKYLEEAQSEIQETLEEYKKDNVVYLEDELGDILWDYLQALKILERDGYINSIESVLAHAHEKYSERLTILETVEFAEEVEEIGLDGVPQTWTTIKNRQKKELKKRHLDLYGK